MAAELEAFWDDARDVITLYGRKKFSQQPMPDR
jgi:hypothetical protein